MNHQTTELIFIKLGGSLITDKSRPRTARFEVIDRLAAEIRTALQDNPGLRIILGHGSGSFGHVPARQYGTRQGVLTSEQWFGFLQVRRDAAALNRIVVDALENEDLLVMPIQPSACVLAREAKVFEWNLAPIKKSLDVGLIPVVYGDVAFDKVLGGTILSTEDLFEYLADNLKPRRILLAGLEPGVWSDYPACTKIIEEITPHNLRSVQGALEGSASPDVTGGMYTKVMQSLQLTIHHTGLDVLIFSGDELGAVAQALVGDVKGTRIYSR